MLESLIELVFEIVKTLAITAIGIGGAWLTAKIAQGKKFSNIAAATEQVILSTQMTVGELNQTIVADLKANGVKLTKEQIADLREKLLTLTVSKISLPIINLLNAASVDIDALIIGAGEDFINQLKAA